MKEGPISVCLLVYNHLHLIDQVIDSILNQTYQYFEFIISDDCSTDGSYEKIIEASKKDKRIVPIKTPENLGMAGNANYAIKTAKNKYIALLHHDDILNQNAFSLWLNCAESNESVAFVFNDYKTEKLPSANFYLRDKLKYINQGKVFLRNILLNQWNCPVRGTALIRRKRFDEIGGINERFGLLADVDLWMRLSSKWDVGYVNEPLIEVRQERPENYPKIYTDFSWERRFILFDIHSSNLNKDNYPNFLHHLFKRFVFRNKVSIEIIKWHLYALLRNKNEILMSYPGNNNYELFYSKYCRYILKKFFMKN